jgi:putative FmdB family regulatory protein
MPTYEYQCEKCGNKFEAVQSIKDEPLKTCPQCGGKVKRLISSGVGLIFKGSGFYITDYKKKESDRGTKRPALKKDDKKDKGSRESKESKENKENKGESKPVSPPAPSSGPSSTPPSGDKKE